MPLSDAIIDVEYKRSTVKSRMDNVIDELVNEEESLRLGDITLAFEE